MGWMKSTYKGEEILWGDTPQDALDDYLERNGYDYRRAITLPTSYYISKRKKPAYSRSEIVAFYERAVNDTSLKEEVDALFMKQVSRPATEAEFKYHLELALFRVEQSQFKSLGVKV